MTPPTAAPFPWIRLDVLLDDGREWRGIMTDQRDSRRAALPTVMGGAGVVDMERDKFGFFIASAWAYLSRHGEIEAMPFVDFAAMCAFAQPVGMPGANGDGETAPDVGPTLPAPAP
jgi:hypothetical protein